MSNGFRYFWCKKLNDDLREAFVYLTLFYIYRTIVRFLSALFLNTRFPIS